jgi:hypothetical protein
MAFFSPLMLLSLAASGLGSYLNTKTEEGNLRRQIDARNAVLMDNERRQQQYAQEAQNELNKSIGEFDKTAQEDQRKDIKDKQSEKFKASSSDKLSYHYGGGKTPKNVQNAVVKSGEESKAVADRDADNLAGLNSFTQSLFDSGQRTRDFGRNIGQISDTAMGQERLVPIEMSAAANNAKRKSSGLGTLLQLAGSAGSMYAGGGGSFGEIFGGKVTTPNPILYGTRANGMPVIPGFGPGGL